MGCGTYVYDNAMYLISGSFCRFIISLFFIVIPFSGIDVVVEKDKPTKNKSESVLTMLWCWFLDAARWHVILAALDHVLV